MERRIQSGGPFGLVRALPFPIGDVEGIVGAPLEMGSSPLGPPSPEITRHVDHCLLTLTGAAEVGEGRQTREAGSFGRAGLSDAPTKLT